MRIVTDHDQVMRGLALLEQADGALMEDDLNWVGTRGYLDDDPDERWFRLLGGHFQGDDRSGGQDWQLWQSENELDDMRSLCRFLCQRHPTAVGALTKLTDYLLGEGFTYRVEAEKDGGNEALAKTVGEWLDAFLENAEWCNDREEEAVRRAHRDGEMILVLSAQDDGTVNVRHIEPYQVCEPEDVQQVEALAVAEGLLGADTAYDWKFGVVTVQGDIERVLGLSVKWDNMWEFLPMSRVVFRKLNADRNVKRGVSDFWCVSKLVRQAEQLLNNTAEGAKVQAAIAFIREHASGMGASKVQSMLASKSEGSYSRPTALGGAVSQRTAHYAPGTVIDCPNGQTYKAGPLAQADTAKFMLIESAVLRMIGQRWSMPEYLVSGDASNGNFASTLVAGDPFVKRIQRLQKWYIAAFKELIWKALALAVERRAIPGVSDLAVIHAAVDLHIEPPSVEVRNSKQDTEEEKILSDAGILSDATWAARKGLDYEQERANGARKAVVAPSGFGRTNPDSPSAVRATMEGRDEVRSLWESYAAGGVPCS